MRDERDVRRNVQDQKGQMRVCYVISRDTDEREREDGSRCGVPMRMPTNEPEHIT